MLDLSRTTGIQGIMGKLVDGVWKDVWYDTASTGGRFVRSETKFRSQIVSDPNAPHPAAANRYHLYVSYACPWAHRALVVRALKQIESLVSVSVVEPLMLEDGWTFSPQHPDHVGQRAFLRDVYTAADPKFSGRVTVPVLWDLERKTIVNNESAEIIRIFNSAFDGLGAAPLDLYPEPLRAEIDELNDQVYSNVNDGVYKAGFATTQAAYEEAVTALFETLDMLESRLEGVDYLVGNTLTEADIRLFTTLIRFDSVYHGHFKCNLRRLVEYPNLWRLTRRIFQLPGVAETVHFDHIKRHYYASHRSINPTGLVPLGPKLDLWMPVA